MRKMVQTGILLIMLVVVACGPTPTPEPAAAITSTPTVVLSVPNPLPTFTQTPPPTPSIAVLFLIDNSLSIDGCTQPQQELRSQIPTFFASILRAKYNLPGSEKNEQPRVEAATLLSSAEELNDKNRTSLLPTQPGNDWVKTLGLDKLDGGRNDYLHSLDQGRKWLENTQADKKILVLITDGWFYWDWDKQALRDSTTGKLNALGGAGIDILLVRLSECVTDPNYSDNKKALDNEVWNKWDKSNKTPHGIISATDSVKEVMKQFVEEPLFADLIPQGGKWWPSDQPDQDMLVTDLPGDTWLLDFGVGSLNLNSVSYDEDGIPKKMMAFGDGAFADRLNSYSPETGCPPYQTQKFVPYIKNTDIGSLAYYWWQPTSYDKELLPIDFKLNKTKVFNREPIQITTFSLNRQKDKSLLAFRSCYKVNLYARSDSGATYTGESYELDHLGDLLNTDLHDRIFKEPFDDQYQTLTFSAEIVKKTSGEKVGGNNAEHPVDIRFRPELVSQESGCKLISCTVVLRYATSKYYDPKVDVDLQVWGFSAGNIPEKETTCDGLKPSGKDKVEAPYKEQYPAIPFHTSTERRYPAKVLSESETGRMSITINLENIPYQACGVKGIIINWPEDPVRQGGWQNIYCLFENTGQCEATTGYRIIHEK